jgi:PAS domain S-box-containing protein
MGELFDNSSNHLESVFQNATDGIILINSRGVIVDVNPAALNLFGYAKEDILNGKINKLMPQPHQGEHDKYIKNYFKTNIPKIIGIGRQVDGMKKDGTLFPFRLAVSEFVSNGEHYFTGVIHDLTREKQIEQNLKNYAEELEERVKIRTRALEEINQQLKTEIDVRQAAEFALRDSQRLYRLIAQNFPNGTINVFDRNLNYIFVEGKDLHEMGITTEQLIGTKFIDRLDKEIRDDVERQLLDVFNSKPCNFEIRVHNNVHSLRAEPLTDIRGRVNQILVVESNVTQRKLAEEEMKQALKKEQEINRMKSAFVSMASHEFRTPLSAILSSATLISKYENQEQQPNRDKHVAKIKSNVKNLTNILEDFLSLEKLNKGIVTAHYSEFNLSEFLEEFADDFKGILKKDQTIKLVLPNPETLIVSDSMILQNIFNNLVSNASKYSEEGEEIEIGSRVEDKLVFWVKDKGIGIPPEDKANMFNRFFRASNSTNIGGTGLGLNIVRNYLKLLKGDITFESELGKGSTFTFRIALTQSNKEQLSI